MLPKGACACVSDAQRSKLLRLLLFPWKRRLLGPVQILQGLAIFPGEIPAEFLTTVPSPSPEADGELEKQNPGLVSSRDQTTEEFKREKLAAELAHRSSQNHALRL